MLSLDLGKRWNDLNTEPGLPIIPLGEEENESGVGVTCEHFTKPGTYSRVQGQVFLQQHDFYIQISWFICWVATEATNLSMPWGKLTDLDLQEKEFVSPQ